MSLPTTQAEVDSQLSTAYTEYYKLISDGADSEAILSQKNVIEELKSLRTAFIGNTEYSNLVASAKSSFKTACKSLSDSDIKTAFLNYKNLSSYISNNSIGVNENTGSPIFSTNISNTFNTSGQKVNIQGE